MSAIETFELATYAVSLIAGEAEGAKPGGPGAIILARSGGAGEGAVSVYLRFYRAAVALPPNSRVVNEDKSRLFMVSLRFDQLGHAVDLLRNEKPVFFKFNERSNTGYLATSDEPVGEGEQD